MNKEAIEIIRSNIPTSGYTMLQEALQMACSALKSNEIAIQGLKDICDPIGAIRRTLTANEKLDGQYAVMLSKDPIHLQSIAHKTLDEIEKESA